MLVALTAQITIHKVTMRIIEILTPERTLTAVLVHSKKRVLEMVSDIAAKSINDIDQKEIYSCLLERERLGSTGLGDGIALPHSRIPGLDKTIGILFSLKQPIDFDSIDQKPVDIVLSLLVPEQSTDEHLQLLAHIAEQFSHPEFRDKIRQIEDPHDLYQLMTSYEQ